MRQNGHEFVEDDSHPVNEIVRKKRSTHSCKIWMRIFYSKRQI